MRPASNFFPASGPGVRGRRAAFTLIEVVISIAVVAFAVISLLGLITMALQSSHNADVQAAQATIVSTITAQLTSQNFTATEATLPLTLYFTAEGSVTNTAAAIYRCDVIDVSPANLATSLMRQVQLLIRWPVPVYTQTNIVVASFAKYD